MTVPAVPWSEVAARLRPFVAHRVPSSDVDDVLQDVLTRMHRGIPDLRDGERLSAWMFQVARSAIADAGRMHARVPAPADDLDETPAPATSDDDREVATALAGCVSLFVARLPSPYREAITLVELEGRTAKEAAQMVGVSVTAMKSRVQRGRARLRELFDRCCEIALDARGKPTDFAPRACRSGGCGVASS